VILTRSRSSKLGGGWGFNKPTQNLYNEYETADPRRDATILNPTDAQIETPAQEIYMGSRYLNRKYALLNADNSVIQLAHATRGPINNKVIRYADVLLMYAEACCETGVLPQAKAALEDVRARARGNAAILPAFPYGTYADNQADLRKAIRHERRVELAMEGHRWFDLCRWGVAKQVMDTYKATESSEAQAEMAPFIEGKHELMPIPAKEIDLNPMDQNPKY
jgi:starch-binding outer membrane protein, SusD/RagB family